MLTAVKGHYEEGKITLIEKPPFIEKAEVIVTFLNSSGTQQVLHRERKLGGLEGKVNLPDDFNEPLDELSDYM